MYLLHIFHSLDRGNFISLESWTFLFILFPVTSCCGSNHELRNYTIVNRSVNEVLA
jgi:hypothetical protein